MAKPSFIPFRLLFSTHIALLLLRALGALAVPMELRVGFKASPSGFTSSSTFSPVLDEASRNFSMGFLLVDKEKLTVAVVHLPSLQLLWQPTTNKGSPLYWSHKAELLFNGSIVVTDSETKMAWSTHTEGDRVIILNSSNVVVESHGMAVWESFHFPGSTLVGSQKFTSDMALVSSNGLYSMRLGENYMAMYAWFDPVKEQIYWKHDALQAKANIVSGHGSIYATIRPEGSFDMYQNGTRQPVDIQPLNSFNRQVTELRIIRMEADGNMKAYIWDGGDWVSDYEAISSICELPSACGNYGLCHPTSGSGTCSCLENRTKLVAGQCIGEVSSSDFCGGKKFRVLRIKGVELPFKELMRYEKVSSAEACENVCQSNCTCWASVYNNATGFCYLVDYPTQTVLSSGDQTKVGYFKVEHDNGKKTKTGLGIGLGILCFAVLALAGAIAYAAKKIMGRKSTMRTLGGELEAFPDHPKSEA